MSGSQIRKIEGGDRTPARDLIEAIEAVPEMACNGALSELYGILAASLGRSAYPGWFAQWPDKEAAARRLRSYQPSVVPGLLQTEAYARAILSTRVGLTAEELNESVTGRMERQRILDRESPPELWVILDEAVLRRPVGGPEVMAKQLDHLASMARQPSIVVRVIPLDAGAHQGMNGGAFVIAEFEETATIAYQDTAVAGQIIENPEHVQALTLTWDTLGLEALPRAQSLELIEEAARTWT